MKIFVAYGYDAQDKIMRVAGVYKTLRAADRRVDTLGSGRVQELTLGQAVRFTYEERIKYIPSRTRGRKKGT
jgi:hypothetical protein